MSDQIYGHINALSMAVEIALKEAYSIRFGETEKARDIAIARIGELMEIAKTELADSDFKTGTIERLVKISNRLREIFK